MGQSVFKGARVERDLGRRNEEMGSGYGVAELMKHASDGKFGINTRNSDIVKYKANARWDQ